MESDRSYTISVFRNSFEKDIEMTLDQLNEFINKGGAAFALFLIAAILMFVIFRKDTKGISGKKTK